MVLFLIFFFKASKEMSRKKKQAVTQDAECKVLLPLLLHEAPSAGGLGAQGVFAAFQQNRAESCL